MAQSCKCTEKEAAIQNLPAFFPDYVIQVRAGADYFPRVEKF